MAYGTKVLPQAPHIHSLRHRCSNPGCLIEFHHADHTIAHAQSIAIAIAKQSNSQ